MLIGCPLIVKLLNGVQGVHRHLRVLWIILGLYIKSYLLSCFENITIAIDAVYLKDGRGTGLNY